MFLILFIIPWLCYATKEIEYRLSKNYGQLIYDFSGHSRHLSNGNSLDTTDYDGKFTDRGFYCSIFTCAVPLSSNPPMNVPNPGTVVVWVKTSSQAGYCFHQFINDSNRILYTKSSSNILEVLYNFNEVTLHSVKGPSDSFLSNQWVMISIIFSGRFIKVHQNLKLMITLDYITEYIQTYRMVLGSCLSNYVTNSFFYYFAVFSSDSVHDKYIGLASSKCFTGDNTCGTCSLSVYLEFENEYGCVSESSNIQTDAFGNSCLNGYTCRDGLSIQCLCESKSCYFQGSTRIECIQKSNGELTQAAVACNSVGQGCCLNICYECNLNSSCLKCVADNAFVDLDGLCTCMNGYYGTRPLTLKSSCHPCNSECKLCTNNQKCTSCIANNSDPYLSSCKCKEGFYQSSIITLVDSCQPCQSECKTCSSNSSCDSCISDNSSPKNSSCKCKEGFYQSSNMSLVDSCKPCQIDCKTCSSISSCDSCISENSFPYLSSCKCKEGFYQSSIMTLIDSCKPCQSECKTCSSNSSCDSCISANSSPYDSSCKCKEGFYQSSSMSFIDSCKACQSECKTCSSISSCDSCISQNSKLSSSRCICEDGFFSSGPLITQSSCQRCDSQCLTCSSYSTCHSCISKNAFPQVSGCKCLDGFFSIGSPVTLESCIKCDTSCRKCDSLTECIECIFPNTLVVNGICKCVQGYFSEGLISEENSCIKCLEHCIQCDKITECSLCGFGFSLVENKCICLEGSWIDNSLNSMTFCRKCKKGCKSCSSFDKCDKCFDLYSKPFKDGCRCIENYFNKTEITKDNICETCKEPHSKLDLLSNDCVCEKMFFNSGKNKSLDCQKCLKFCEICENSSSCKKCSSGFFNEFDRCRCPEGFSLINETCIQNFFGLRIKVSKSNNLLLEFSENLKNNLSVSDLKIKISNEPLFSFEVFSRSKSKSQIILKFKESVGKNSDLKLNFSLRPVFSSNYSELDIYEYQVRLFELDYIEDSAQIMTEIILGLAKGLILTSIVFSFTNSRDFFNLMNTLKMIQFIPLGFARITPMMKKLCKNIFEITLVPNFFLYFMKNQSGTNLVNEVTESGISSIDFLINSGESLSFFIFALLPYPIFLCISKIRVKWIAKRFIKFSKKYKYRYFIRFWIQSYLEIAIFSAIQIFNKAYLIHSQEKTSEYYVNYTCSIIFLIFISLTPPIILSILLLNESKIKDSRNLEFKERFGTLFDEFKIDKGLPDLGFYVYFTFRRLFYVFGLVFLSAYNVFQMSLHCCFSLLNLIFMLKVAKFKKNDNKIVNVLSEMAIFLCFFSVLVMNFFNSGIQDKYLEKVFCYSILGYLIVLIIGMIFNSLVFIRKLWNKQLQKRALQFVRQFNKMNHIGIK